MEIPLFFNLLQNDLFFYGALIVGTILFVGLVVKLMGFQENQNEMNKEYREDDEFWYDDDFFDDF